ncbi:hypothetical protein BT69DRAFT_1331333 [Atractiella rhizophila]|nr:hypothetical protein BT69DRAFT_1331333 [Atractiella rhizophila]
MIWPNNLAQIALNRSFHFDKNLPANVWRISRLRFFLIVFIRYGLYFVFPNNLIAPNNVNVAAITGSAFYSGMGLNPWPIFDWNQISALNNPLISPLFSTCNQVAGILRLGLAFIPAEAYNNYYPAYWGVANALLYGFFFAFYTAGLVHAALYHYKPIIDGFHAMKKWKNAQKGYNDLHNRLMRNYADCVHLLILFYLISELMLMAGSQCGSTIPPIWGFVICIALAFIFVVPAGMITAVGTVQIILNVIAELIGGYALPGKPLANVLFKSYGLLVTSQAITYASDLKLGHYLKLQFWAQTIATVWAAFVSLGVIKSVHFFLRRKPIIDLVILLHIDNYGTPNQSAHFTHPVYNTFFSAALFGALLDWQKCTLKGRNALTWFCDKMHARASMVIFVYHANSTSPLYLHASSAFPSHSPSRFSENSLQSSTTAHYQLPSLPSIPPDFPAVARWTGQRVAGIVEGMCRDFDTLYTMEHFLSSPPILSLFTHFSNQLPKTSDIQKATSHIPSTGGHMANHTCRPRPRIPLFPPPLSILRFDLHVQTLDTSSHAPRVPTIKPSSYT